MAIKFKSLSYVYDYGMPYAHKAVDSIDLAIREGVITAVIGETGSGKSTMVEHLNALLMPTEGELEVLDYNIIANEKTKGLKNLRKQVGLVFQFSEYQLFEETVIKDVAFGPKNFGMSEEEATKKAMMALKLVGLDESYYELSPLELSGGQKRRVAIAGILASEPKVIVLDEPTAGLDPRGAKDMINLFVELNKKFKTTVIIVSHDNEMVYNYCEDVVVMKKGKVGFHGKTVDLFWDNKMLEDFNLLEPQIVTFKKYLMEKGFELKKEDRTIEAIAKRVAKEVNR